MWRWRFACRVRCESEVLMVIVISRRRPTRAPSKQNNFGRPSGQSGIIFRTRRRAQTNNDGDCTISAAPDPGALQDLPEREEAEKRAKGSPPRELTGFSGYAIPLPPRAPLWTAITLSASTNPSFEPKEYPLVAERFGFHRFEWHQSPQDDQEGHRMWRRRGNRMESRP